MNTMIFWVLPGVVAFVLAMMKNRKDARKGDQILVGQLIGQVIVCCIPCINIIIMLIYVVDSVNGIEDVLDTDLSKYFK